MVLIPSCGGGGSSTGPPNPRDAARVMLRERAAQLRAGNLEGWLAPVATEARAAEEALGSGALSVPLARVDLTLGRATVEASGTRFRRAVVELLYRYEDLPEDNLFRYFLEYDLERRDGAWVITASGRARSPDLPPPPPWADGPVDIAASDHFLALSTTGTPGVQQALQRAERGLAQLLPKLTLEADDRYLLVVAADAAGYAKMLGEDDDASAGTVALAVSLLRAPGGNDPEHVTAGNRSMYVDLSAVESNRPVTHEQDDDAFPAQVFQHELGHLALSRFTRSSTPRWVVEGGAMFLAGERRIDGWRKIIDDGLLGTDEFRYAAMVGPIGGIQYSYANAGVSYLVERSGPATFWDFYQNFKELVMENTPAVRAQGADRLLRRYYQMSLEELDERTAERIRAAVAAGG